MPLRDDMPWLDNPNHGKSNDPPDVPRNKWLLIDSPYMGPQIVGKNLKGQWIDSDGKPWPWEDEASLVHRYIILDKEPTP